MDGLGASIVDWWELAGVDSYVDDQPRDWLARVEPRPAPAAEPAAPVRPAAPALPADLAGFRAWLLRDGTVPGRPTARFDATGDPEGGAMVLLDMPEAGDREARQLLSGEAGALFDRMLGAIDLSRSAAYLAPFSPARPMAGTLDDKAVAALLPLARHHIALAAPKRLLLVGEAPIRALTGLGTTAARGRTFTIETGGIAVPAIATFPPRFLLQATAADDLKARRALVWADLQLFRAL